MGCHPFTVLKHTHSHIQLYTMTYLGMTIGLHCMSLDCVGKLEYLEKTHQAKYKNLSSSNATFVMMKQFTAGIKDRTNCQKDLFTTRD